MAGLGSHSEDHILLNRLGDEPPVRIVAIPLVVRDRSVAVLYADSAELDADAINLEALETLVRVAGMAVELLAARSAPARQPIAPQPTEAASAEAVREQEPPRAYAPVAEYDEITPVVEESAPAPEVVAAEVEVEAEPEPPTEVEPEVLATHHEAVPEPSVTHFEAATPIEAPAEVQPLAPVEIPRARGCGS